MPSSNKAPSEAQLTIMRALWSLKQGSVSEIQQHEGVSGYARTTVATMLTRLEKQGFVEMQKVHGINTYLPLVKKDDMRRRSVGSLISGLFSGNKTELVSHLISEDVTEEDLDTVMQLLEEKKKSLKTDR